MMTTESHISTAFVVGVTVASVVALALTIALVAIWLLADDFDRGMGMGIAGVLLAFTVGGAAVTLYPYDMQYHRYAKVDGTIGEIKSRLLADGDGGSTANFAVRFTASPSETYRCDDTRCALLKPGDHLTLWCIRDWQMNAVPGWRCNFGDATPVG